MNSLDYYHNIIKHDIDKLQKKRDNWRKWYERRKMNELKELNNQIEKKSKLIKKENPFIIYFD